MQNLFSNIVHVKLDFVLSTNEMYTSDTSSYFHMSNISAEF